jgi:hypothetical protein
MVCDVCDFHVVQTLLLLLTTNIQQLNGRSCEGTNLSCIQEAPVQTVCLRYQLSLHNQPPVVNQLLPGGCPGL